MTHNDNKAQALWDEIRSLPCNQRLFAERVLSAITIGPFTVQGWTMDRALVPDGVRMFVSMAPSGALTIALMNGDREVVSRTTSRFDKESEHIMTSQFCADLFVRAAMGELPGSNIQGSR